MIPDLKPEALMPLPVPPLLQEAAAALSMNNLNLMGSLIKVELAASAYRASPQVS